MKLHYRTLVKGYKDWAFAGVGIIGVSIVIFAIGFIIYGLVGVIVGVVFLLKSLTKWHNNTKVKVLKVLYAGIGITGVSIVIIDLALDVNQTNLPWFIWMPIGIVVAGLGGLLYYTILDYDTKFKVFKILFAGFGITGVSVVIYGIATGQGIVITPSDSLGIFVLGVIGLIGGVALFFYGLSNMKKKKLMQSLPTSGGLLPRKNEQRKPFGCMIGKHSWIKDDLKGIKTCKFCDATEMMGEIFTITTRVTPWRERKFNCMLGFHSDPNPGVFGDYFCEYCGTPSNDNSVVNVGGGAG